MKVHLMVAVEGRLFRKWFPAAPNLSYDFVWDKADVYSQKVYGLSEAFGKQWPSDQYAAWFCFIHSQFTNYCFLCVISFLSFCWFWIWVMSRLYFMGEEDCCVTGLWNHCLQTWRMDCRQAPCIKYPEWWVNYSAFIVFISACYSSFIQLPSQELISAQN